MSVANDVHFTDLTLQEALDILEDDGIEDEFLGIFLDPPEINVDSDEDSGAEDGGIADNLTGRQLRARAQFQLTRSARENQGLEDSSNSDATEPATKKAKKAKLTFDWKKKDLQSKNVMFPEGNYTALTNLSPVEVFELFFDSEVIEYLVSESNKYAVQKNDSNPSISVEEMKVFLGILLLSGYVQLPEKRSFWEDAVDVHNILVVESMRRNRFLDICRYLHCTDNTTIPTKTGDKLWKVRPLFEKLSSRFMAQYRPERCMDYDESMIRYYGRHSCKQFIRGKPIRFGYKVWCLNAQSGYLVSFDPYQGKGPSCNEDYANLYGKAAAPLVVMLDNFPLEKRMLPYELFFDNLFTGMKLLVDLKERGYGSTGTIRENRVPNDCKLRTCKEMMKADRGTFDYCSDTGKNVLVVRWKDNKVVTVASTSFGIEPKATVSRFCREKRQRIKVTQPSLVREYNRSMGGTDMMDQDINTYRIGMRSKKWWWPFFSWAVDASVHNAWILYRKTGKQEPKLDFIRSIAQTYLIRFKTESRGPTRRLGFGPSAEEGLRYDGLNHFVIPNPGNNRLRCAGDFCKSQVRTSCSKCLRGLCIPCFKDYHTKK